MRKTTAVLLSLVLLLAAFLPAAAGADTAVKLADDVRSRDGKVTISWHVTGTGVSSFKVYAKFSSGDSKQTRYLIGMTSSNSITTGRLMPGKRYEITVTDVLGNQLGSKSYKMPKEGKFKDSKLKSSSVKVTITPMKQSGSSKPKKATLKAKTIKKAVKKNGDAYSVKYHIKMPRLTKDRSFFVSIFIQAPNDFMKCALAQDVDFDKVSNGYQTLWLDMLDTDFFPDLYEATKEIPSGKYKITMYWDGMLVNSSTFKVK